MPGWTVINHVLANFPAEDLPKINEAIKYLIPAVECIVNEDIDHAMNKFNPKKVKKKKPESEKTVLEQESEKKEMAVDHGEV